jgi:hypothetical protein
METLAAMDIVSPTNTFPAASYVGGDGEMHLWQLTSDFGAISAQVIPEGTIENHTTRTPGTGRSRTSGIAGFNDRVVVATEDMTGGDAGAVFGYSNPGESILVLTIYDDDGNVITPTFAYPNGGRNSPARQSVVTSGHGDTRWFIVRTATDTATVFNDTGGVIADLGHYLEGAALPPGLVSLAPGGEDCAIAAAGEPEQSRAYIATRGVDGEGKHHPCAIVVDLVPSASSASVIGVLQLDDDIPAAPDFTDGSAMDLSAYGEGYLFAVWKQFPSQSPVGRFYDTDGTPLSPSFWISSLEDGDTNTGDATIKCTCNREVAAVAWLSESHDPGNNCVGNPMERDTMVRMFSPAWLPLAVEDWEGY